MSLEVVFPIDAPQSDVVSWLRRYGGIVDERLVISDGTLGRGLFAKAQRGSGGNPLNPLVLDVGCWIGCHKTHMDLVGIC